MNLRGMATRPRRIAYDATEMADEELTESISLRLSEADTKLLEDLASRFSMMKKLVIARHALRLGLAQISKDPSLLLQTVPSEAPADRKSEPKPKKR